MKKVVRKAIFEAWDGHCAYCGAPNATTLDHVLPRHKGGLSLLNNLVPACHKCNQQKGATLVDVWYQNYSFFSARRWAKIKAWITTE